MRKKQYRLFILDDEFILRNGLKHLCKWEDYGFTVVGESANGQEALDLIPKLNPHIILMDIVMPVMDGISFAKIIHEKYPHIKMLVLSSFSEFDYVRESFKYGVSDYLLKPKLNGDELIQLLRKLCEEIEEPNTPIKKEYEDAHTLQNILYPFNEIDSNYYRYLKQALPKSHFVLIKCTVKNEQYATKEEFKNHFSKMIRDQLRAYSVIDVLFQNEYTVMVNLDSQELDSLAKKLNDLALIQQCSITGIKFIMSEAFTNIEWLPAKNKDLTIKMGQLFYFKDETFILETYVTPSDVTEEFDLSLFSKQWGAFNFEEARSYLSDYFKRVQIKRSLEEYSFKRLSQNIIYNTINITQQLGFDMSEINRCKIKLFKQIDQSSDVEVIISIIGDILQEIIMITNRQSEHKNSIILEKVRQYVENHYREEITLSDIADKLHLNYYYLSTYFKTQTSENLTTYINKFRVEKAKSLLKQTDLSIAEISAQVGFSDHNYFSKVFKKISGSTPSSYRRKQQGWLK